MPAFWGYPPPPPPPASWTWLPILFSHIECQVNRRQSQSYKFKELAKITNFLILKQSLHPTHLLKLLERMCKYEIDPTSIVEDRERTRFCPETDGWTDRRTDKVKPVYPPFNFIEAGGIIIPTIKIRQSWDHLTFIMGIPLLVRWYLLLRQHPGCSFTGMI